MAKVRARKDNGLLFLDFYYRGVRCREQTALPDTAENRRRVQSLMNRVSKEIKQGQFDYGATFPGSPRAAQFADLPSPTSGAYPDVGLADARARRDSARKQLAAGIDPGEHRKAEKAVGREQAANSFEVIAREWLQVRKPGWTDKNFDKEQCRLKNHAFPYIGGRPIASLGVSDIRPLIERLSKARHLEQAHRLRFQLSRVFKYAVATGRAERDPAADLSEALPSRRDMVKERYPTITEPKRMGDLLRAIDGFAGTFVGPVPDRHRRVCLFGMVRH